MPKNIILSVMMIIVLLALWPLTALAATGSVHLALDHPTTNEDGSPLTDLAGCKIHYGTTSRQYTTTLDAKMATTATVTNLLVGQAYFFGATCYDISGNSSAFSNEVSTTIPEPPGLPGSVLLFGFEEGTGTTVADISGNSNTGTLVSGTTWTPNGKFGKALSFDGTNDMVTVADSASLDLTTALTVSAWLYPTVISGTWRRILWKERPTGNFAYNLTATDDVLKPRFSIFTTTSYTLKGPTALPINTWSHLTATYDGQQLRLYLNGAEVANTAATGIMPATTGTLRIGGNAKTANYFKGMIDEVRIYTRALSVSEIQQDMLSPVVPTVAPPASPGATLVELTITP